MIILTHGWALTPQVFSGNISFMDDITLDEFMTMVVELWAGKTLVIDDSQVRMDRETYQIGWAQGRLLGGDLTLQNLYLIVNAAETAVIV